jgi:membrane-associated phospholipid phosphatase
MPTPAEEPLEDIKEVAQEAVAAETTSRPKREYRTVLFQVALFSAVGAFAVLTFLAKSTPFFALDLEISRSLQTIDSPFFAALMEWISWPGYLPQSVVISIFLALLIYGFGMQWEAVTALVAAFFPQLLNVLIKEIIRRPRPTVDLVDVFKLLDSYSFPSGHVMFYIAFFGFLWFLVFTLLKQSMIRALLLVLLGILIVFIGVSRIYLGHHWASDVLGASLLGGVTLVLIIQFYRWGKKRFFVRQPVAPQ